METTLASLLERAEAWPKEDQEELLRLAEQIEKKQSKIADWQAHHIGRALDAMRKDNDPDFAHDDVARWLRSWGKPGELPPPPKSDP
jgi:hypothetical protein